MKDDTRKKKRDLSDGDVTAAVVDVAFAVVVVVAGCFEGVF